MQTEKILNRGGKLEPARNFTFVFTLLKAAILDRSEIELFFTSYVYFIITHEWKPKLTGAMLGTYSTDTFATSVDGAPGRHGGCHTAYP